MAKRVKDKWLGARVEESFLREVTAYVDENEITAGELVRWAVVEYMKNHPAPNHAKQTQEV